MAPMKRIIKGTWTSNGQHWDNKVELVEAAEFLSWKYYLPYVAEESIDRRYLDKLCQKTELQVFADASEETICTVAYLCSQLKDFSAEKAFVIRKCRVAPMRNLFNTTIGIAFGSYDMKVEATHS